ncbi:MAG: ABC transporter permease [Caloramator sp.]|nr:ABC transporter permease [Caloramator sp.]
MLAESLSLIFSALLETLYMVLFSTLFAIIFGFPMGIVLVLTQKGGLLENLHLNKALNSIINTARSIPFIILIIILFPLSRIIVGTSIGSTAAIVPLSIAASPFVARIIETSLNEVDKRIIEAAVSLGANTPQIVFKVMLKEALPSLISGLTLTIINILGYSAMAGAIGGGGLGDLAIRYGYQRFRTDILIVTVIILILFVEVVQRAGNRWSRRFDKR